MAVVGFSGRYNKYYFNVLQSHLQSWVVMVLEGLLRQPVRRGVLGEQRLSGGDTLRSLLLASRNSTWKERGGNVEFVNVKDPGEFTNVNWRFH